MRVEAEQYSYNSLKKKWINLSLKVRIKNILTKKIVEVKNSTKFISVALIFPICGLEVIQLL